MSVRCNIVLDKGQHNIIILLLLDRTQVTSMHMSNIDCAPNIENYHLLELSILILGGGYTAKESCSHNTHTYTRKPILIII